MSISPEHVEQITTTARACFDAGCQPTSVLMLAFRALGKKLGYQVASKHCDADFGEWLYDMSWSKTKEGFFVSQPLVIESEISNCDPGVDPDLHKLIQARADVRIWMAKVKPGQGVEHHVELCWEQIKRFAGTQPEDFYIFVIFKPNNEPAYFKCFKAREIG